MSVLRASILGGIDGVITSFAVMAGASVGGLSNRDALLIGVSSVLADGFSMGASEYVSSYATSSKNARLLGLSCFSVFVLLGAVPILVFTLSRSLLSCAMFALVELFVLGAVRTRFTDEPLLLGVFQTALVGAAAGGIAYGVAILVERV